LHIRETVKRRQRTEIAGETGTEFQTLVTDGTDRPRSRDRERRDRQDSITRDAEKVKERGRETERDKETKDVMTERHVLKRDKRQAETEKQRDRKTETRNTETETDSDRGREMQGAGQMREQGTLD
jgi:hypothetical protein